MNVTAPQSQHPVVDLDRSWNRDDERCGREEKPEVRVHSTHVHVVRPHHEAEGTNRHDGPYHHAIAKDVLPRMGADQVGDDAERRQRNDVDFRVSEEPE